MSADVQRARERDYLERTIATVRIHKDADNSWPQWANIFADEIERLWEREAASERRVAELEEELEELKAAAGKVYYGPAKGHLAIKAWRELGETLAVRPAKEQP